MQLSTHEVLFSPFVAVVLVLVQHTNLPKE